MHFNNNHYDAIGTAMVEELYKQSEEIYPINDDAPHKPSLFKRIIRSLRGSEPQVQHTGVLCADGEDLRRSV